MVMATGNGRAREFAEWEHRPVKDLDPELDVPASGEESEESQDEVNNAVDTEHYFAVSKSKLRRKEPVSLGPHYAGTQVSRSALVDQESTEEDIEVYHKDDEEDGVSRGSGRNSDSEDYDDPDMAGSEATGAKDEEIDSDEALGESDEERFRNFTFRGSAKPKDMNGKRARRPTAADFIASDDDDSEPGGAGLIEEMHGVELTDASSIGSSGDDTGSDDDESAEPGASSDEDDQGDDGDEARNDLRELFKGGSKSIISTMSQAAKEDVTKGVAVRQQRRAFDVLLNMRIRLQKALVAANSFSAVEDDAGQEREPYEAAELAALQLWNTIDGFRQKLTSTTSAKTGEKRKREVDPTLASQEIWHEMKVTEEPSLANRKKVLDRWSTRTRSTALDSTKRRLGSSRKLGTGGSDSLVSILEDQLLSSERLVKRTRTPRSCAPIQASKKVEEDAQVYDDADFYQLMLKELVDQRSIDMSSAGAGITTVKWAAVKEAKTRKQVDRKASKGRKLRYTVHEKLQNFMAPEDRRTWEQERIDGFFGSLCGPDGLKEKDASEDEEMEEVTELDDGFRMFG